MPRVRQWEVLRIQEALWHIAGDPQYPSTVFLGAALT